MPNNPYPQWRRDRCVHCAAGLGMSCLDKYHWVNGDGHLRCTAPTADERIAELEAKLAEARDELGQRSRTCERYKSLLKSRK